MRVKCIDNLSGKVSLTIGKEYHVINTNENGWYWITNDIYEANLYRPEQFEIIKETKPKTDEEYISKIESLMEERRNKNPLQQEFNRLYYEMYPTKQFESIYKLGMASMLAYFKNDWYKYFCKDCKNNIDLIIKSWGNGDEEMIDFINKLIK